MTTNKFFYGEFFIVSKYMHFISPYFLKCMFLLGVYQLNILILILISTLI